MLFFILWMIGQIIRYDVVVNNWLQGPEMLTQEVTYFHKYSMNYFTNSHKKYIDLCVNIVKRKNKIKPGKVIFHRKKWYCLNILGIIVLQYSTVKITMNKC